jgi:hypothetical protein
MWVNGRVEVIAEPREEVGEVVVPLRRKAKRN